MTDAAARFKQQAGDQAASLVHSGMVVGLGTGSTAIFAIRRVAARLRTGDLSDILAIATSRATDRTDQGNIILDCRFGPITDPAGLAGTLDARAGLVGHGLFIGIAFDVIVAGEAGMRHLRRGVEAAIG